MGKHREYPIRRDMTLNTYYDRGQRLWCAYVTDSSGYQTGDACYGLTEAEAVAEATLAWSRDPERKAD